MFLHGGVPLAVAVQTISTTLLTFPSELPLYRHHGCIPIGAPAFRCRPDMGVIPIASTSQ